MPDFNAHHVLAEVEERGEQLREGPKLIPILAAIIAVFAALATLYSNHSSVSGLESRTLAGIYQTRAADDYNYYESSRIKIELNQALLQGGIVTQGAALKNMTGRIAKEDTKSAKILATAKSDEEQAKRYLDHGEASMRSYEKFEVSATLFEVSIVLVSITALMRTRLLMYVAGVASVTGLIYFAMGLSQR